MLPFEVRVTFWQILPGAHKTPKIGVNEFKQTPFAQADVFKKIVPFMLNYPKLQLIRFLQILIFTKLVKFGVI